MRIRPGLRQIDVSGNFTVFPRMRLSGSHRAVAPGGCAVASVVQVHVVRLAASVVTSLIIATELQANVYRVFS